MPETEKPFHEGLTEVASVTGETRRRRDKFIYETVKKQDSRNMRMMAGRYPREMSIPIE